MIHNRSLFSILDFIFDFFISIYSIPFLWEFIKGMKTCIFSEIRKFYQMFCGFFLLSGRFHCMIKKR